MGGRQRTTLFMGVSSTTERVQKTEPKAEEKGKKGSKKSSSKAQ